MPLTRWFASGFKRWRTGRSRESREGRGLDGKVGQLMYAQRWYKWFAWRPVRLDGGKVAWMRWVERRGCEDMGGEWTEYRALTAAATLKEA